MKRVILPLLLFAFIAACVSKDVVPADMIQQEKMKMVMWDMIRADEFLAGYVFSKDSTADKRRVSDSLYASVFRIHHISPDEFKKSFNYYRTHPAEMRTLVDSLSNMSTNNSTLNFKPPAYIDTSVHKGSLKAQ